MSIGTEQFHTFEDSELEGLAAQDVARYLSNHVVEGFAAERTFRYVAELINRLPADKAAAVIGALAFDPALRALTAESRFLPSRQIPIAVDVPLRFDTVDPQRADAIFAAYRGAIVADGRPEPKPASVEEVMFFLARNPREDDEGYRRVAHETLDRHFPTLTADQLNRVFDESNTMNVAWLRSHADDLIASGYPEVLARVLLLSAAHLPDRVAEIRSAIAKLGPTTGVSRPVGTLTHWILNDTATRLVDSRPVARATWWSRRRRERKPKIAICVSGQLRGYERAFPTWADALRLDEVEPHFFVSTWRGIGGKRLSAAHMYRYFPTRLAEAISSRWLEIGEGEFRRQFPALCALVESGGSADEDTLRSLYGTRDVLIHEDALFPPDRSNSERMHFKIESSWAMAAESGIDFDLVLRIRPDKELEVFKEGIDWSRLADVCRNDRVAFSDFAPRLRRHQGNAIGDQILLASAQTARVLHRPFTVANAMNQAGGAFVVPSGFRAHATLGGISLVAGIDIRRMPGLVLSDRQLLNSSSPSIDAIRAALRSDRTTENKRTADALIAIAKA